MTGSSRGTNGWDAVLFDLDGTLVDTVPLIIECYKAMMQRHRGHSGSIEEWLTTIGRPLSASLADIAEDEEEAAALLATYIEVQDGLHDQMVTLFEGMSEVLTLANQLELPQAIVTSKGRWMTDRSIAVSGFEDHFSVIITADDVKRAKPDPEPVLLALEQLGVAASRSVLFIGDSLHDLESGHAAGVQTAAVTWGALGESTLREGAPDYLVRTVGELIPILKRAP